MTMQTPSYWLAIAASILVLTGCDRYRMHEAEAKVSDQLFDPTSALFKKSEVNSATGAVCGLVNGKNRYGAYVGFRPFVVTSAGAVTVAGDPPAELEPFDAAHADEYQLDARKAYLERQIEELKAYGNAMKPFESCRQDFLDRATQ